MLLFLGSTVGTSNKYCTDMWYCCDYQKWENLFWVVLLVVGHGIGKKYTTTFPKYIYMFFTVLGQVSFDNDTFIIK